ncbi:MAG: 6-phosphogluconolactonase [Deltaproteobacteria bacterium]|nr:6-phosphogluconolactonase [Deltaproteobacteria bacterium]
MDKTKRLYVYVYIYASPEEMSRVAAETFVETCEKRVKAKGLFTVILSGGKTPERLYRLLGTDFKDKIPWEKVHLFWGDERCVGPESRESNYKMAYDSLISKVSIPERNIHRIKGEIEPSVSAKAYEDEIRGFFNIPASAFPVFDLVLLGLGNDGHTLSLFPASKALFESERLIIDNYVDKLSAFRITATLPVINNASMGIFLVSGKEKAGILREVLKGTEAIYPAQMARPGKLLWFVDKDAASEL